MEVEKNFRPEELEARGALCVECLGGVGAGEALIDRTGRALCRTCAAEFYAPCAGCGGLVPRDEALARASDGAVVCAECHAGGASSPDGEPAPSEDEVEALVGEYVALYEESKRLGARLEEIKERLKLAAQARPRVSNAVVLRAGEAGVRCGFSVRTTYDPARLESAAALLGGEFDSLFERKVSFSPVKGGRLEEFLSAADAEHDAAREAVRAAEQRSETVTLTVVAQKKKK